MDAFLRDTLLCFVYISRDRRKHILFIDLKCMRSLCPELKTSVTDEKSKKTFSSLLDSS